MKSIQIWQVIWFILLLILLVATSIFIYYRKKKKDKILKRLNYKIKTKNESDANHDIEGVNQVRKATKRYFIGEVLAVLIASVLTALSLWYIAEKIDNLVLKNGQGDTEPKTAEEFILHHFDFTGVTIGIVGIIIGILIYIVVENNNEQKSIDLNRQLGVLREINNEIKGYLSSLNPVYKLKRRLKAIKDVVKHAQQNGNSLYILSYAPNYGQLHIANLGIIKKEFPKAITPGITHKELADCIKKLKGYENKNRDAIRSYIDEVGKIKLAFLKSPCMQESYSDKFRDFIEDRVIKDDKNILQIDMESNIPIPMLKEKEENTFIYITSGIPATNESKKENIIKEFLHNDENLFDYFKIKNLPVYGLDYVPFQYFISIPEREDGNKNVIDDNKDTKCKGLIIFTNYYNIGQENGVASFSTENSTLCIGLKEMFDGLIKVQEEKDNNDKNNPIKIIFGTDIAYKIKIILKNIDITGVERFPEFKTHGEVTTVADSKTKDDLFDLFKDNDIAYTPNVKFIKKDEVDAFLTNEKEKRFTFLSVGLFYNPISDQIGQDYNDELQNSNFVGKLFKLTHRHTTQDGTPVPKKIEIAKQIKKGEKGEKIVYEEQMYEEVFSNEKSDERGNYDYAIFSKEKINGKWIFVCGGVNYFASQHIVKCLTSDVWAEHKNKIRNREFIALFKVNKDETTELKNLSVIENGTIKKIASV